ncbi:TetR/AcrR family transcriptional regulator [Aliihoeflea sp. PC F10.4]
MTGRKRGRPRADAKAVSPKQILEEALGILDADGLDGLSMRALATRAGINPMTIYHHFEDRNGLIKAVAEIVYADVIMPETGEAFDRARNLLTDYYAKVVRYPSLTLAIFARPAIFPDHARRITAELTALLQNRDHPPCHAARWTNILVDYTHGAALAVAIRDKTTSPQLSREAMLSNFQGGLTELLEAFKRRTCEVDELVLIWTKLT